MRSRVIAKAPHRSHLPFMLVAAVLGCSGHSQQPVVVGVQPEPPIHDRVSRARQVLAPAVTSAVGVSVAVAHRGALIWSEAHGYRNLEERLPATPSTTFRFYSVAKPMTAVGAARLVELGRLALDAPVQRYLPDFPDKGAAITTMHLGTHTSGVRHYRDDAEARSTLHCTTVAEAVRLFRDDPLVHPPGTGETYSSWGYVLLSAVVEAVAGQSYPDAMSQLVFAPLGIGSLAIDDPTRSIPSRSRFYAQTSSGFAQAEPVDNTCKWGAGGWVGTAEDVARFGLSLVDDSLLQPETRQLLRSGQTVYRAQGWGAGGMAFLLVDDAHDLSIALLSNTTGEATGAALQRALSELHAIFAPAGQARD